MKNNARFQGLGMVVLALITRSDVETNPRTSYCLSRSTLESDALTDTGEEGGEVRCGHAIGQQLNEKLSRTGK